MTRIVNVVDNHSIPSGQQQQQEMLTLLLSFHFITIIRLLIKI